MLVIKYLRKRKRKAQLSKNKNDKKIDAQMSKDENGMKIKNAKKIK